MRKRATGFTPRKVRTRRSTLSKPNRLSSCVRTLTGKAAAARAAVGASGVASATWSGSASGPVSRVWTVAGRAVVRGCGLAWHSDSGGLDGSASGGATHTSAACQKTGATLLEASFKRLANSSRKRA